MIYVIIIDDDDEEVVSLGKRADDPGSNQILLPWGKGSGCFLREDHDKASKGCQDSSWRG